MSVDVGSAVGYLDLDISGFLKNWKSAQDEADSASKNIATKIGKNLSSAGQSLQTAGSTLTKTVTVPVAGLGVAAIKTTSDFDSAMSKVSAISGATGDDLDHLRDKAKEMGAETKFSATESAEAFTYMAMAGWKTEDMLDGISGIMSLAAADGLDLATTSDIVTDALTAFGLTAKDSGEFADILAATASNANTNVHLLGETFKYAAPVAGALGYSVEDTAEAIGLMANAGIKGSQAGTSLRSIFTKLTGDIELCGDKLGEVTIKTTNADGSMREFSDILSDCRSAFDQLTESEQASMAKALVGQEAMSGFLAIMNAAPADIEKLNKAINSADGSAQRMADTMLNNLGGQLTLLKSAVEGVAIELGEILMPYITKFVSKIQDLVAWFASLSTEQKEQVVKWAAIAIAIGPVLTVVGKLISGFGSLFTTFGKIPGAIKSVATGFKTAVNSVKNVGEAFKLAKAGWTGLAGSTSKLGAALAGVTGPMIALVAVVAGLVAAFVSLWKNNEDFRNRIIQIWNEITQTFTDFFAQITERINSLGFDFSSFAEVLKAIWQGLCDFLAPIFIGVFQIISDTLKAILDGIISVVDFFIAIFQGDWEGAWDAVKDYFVTTWNWIVDIFKAIGEMLLGALDAICGWFGTTWEETWEAIKKFFVDTLNAIVAFFVNAWNSIKTTVSDTVNKIWTDITTTFESVKSSISSIWEGIKTSISNAIDGAQKAVSDTVDTVQKNISDGFNAAWQTVTGIFDNIKKSISDAMESAQTTVSNVIEKIKGFFDFEWSLPKLKMPKITITGKFSLNPLQVPKFSISWFKSAMENGMILSSPTIFGFDSSTGKFLAGGEAGSETVVGTKSLMKMIQNAVNNAMRQNYSRLIQDINSIYQNFTTSSRDLVDLLSKILDATHLYTLAVENIGVSGRSGARGGSVDYTLLAAALADILRDSPIEPKIEVYMEDGDVYLDKERVGRSVAPVVSRVVVQK